jgi:hypothetical protein
MDIDGIGERLIEDLVEAGKLKSFIDFYCLTVDDIMTLEGYGLKSAQNIIDAIEQSKNVEFHKLIFALGIRGVGESVSKDVAGILAEREMGSGPMLEELKSVEGIGNKIAENIVSFFNDPATMDEQDDLAAILKIKFPVKKEKRNTPFTDKVVVITGSFNGTDREEMKVVFENWGAKVSGSVSKNTDFLIAGAGAGSSKINKANDLGVTIVNEDSFWDIVIAIGYNSIDLDSKSEFDDTFFKSEGLKYIYILTKMDGKSRMRALEVTDECYKSHLAATKWRNHILDILQKEFDNNSDIEDEFNRAIEKLHYIYDIMTMSFD